MNNTSVVQPHFPHTAGLLRVYRRQRPTQHGVEVEFWSQPQFKLIA